MNVRSLTFAVIAGCLCAAGIGCMNAPGKPKLQAEAARPNEVLDFPALYKQNCAACHGESGKNGAAIPLANPVYLATAGFENIRRVTAAGVPGTLMPPFGKKAGGMLTDAQITALAQGMISAWSRPSALAGAAPLPYQSQLAGTPAQGQAAFTPFCASCHGANGTGSTAHGGQPGSIVDPAYLALVSDQGLRSIIIAGFPGSGMPDWRSDLPTSHARAMTDQEVADIVAWLASHRTATPGQPYPQHP
ncbi:MAG: cytochrome c family protein [Acidobacteriaceae bacterium]|nr:cytochrome c family protein [Acidobacteriaceae bacterium]